MFQIPGRCWERRETGNSVGDGEVSFCIRPLDVVFEGRNDWRGREPVESRGVKGEESRGV